MIEVCDDCGTSVLVVFTQDGGTIALDTTPLPDDVLEGWIVDGTLARPYDLLTDQPIRTRYLAHRERCPKQGPACR